MKLVRYRTDEGVFTGLLVLEGHKWLHVILMDSAIIRVRKVPVTEQRYMREMEGYSIKRAVRKFRAAGEVFGITDGARRALKGV